MNKVRVWIKNARSTSLMQSVMPAILAVVMAFGSEDFSIWASVVAVLGIVAAHLGMNLADDYFDYKVGTSESRKHLVRQGFRARLVKYPYLTDGSASVNDLKKAIVSFLAVAAVLGLSIVLFSTYYVIPIVLITLFLGLFYSAAPLKLSYRGLGELVIGLIFGPLLMSGIYIASAGVFETSILWISIPMGLLVTNILFTHSFIDQIADKASGKVTLAVLIGNNKGNFVVSLLLNLLPFAMIVTVALLGYISYWYLLCLLVLPRALWLLYSLKAFCEKKEVNTDRPAWFLGRMENWERIKQSGTEWFMIRWYCARNIISDFCLIIILIKILSYL
ncbi:MAG: prenyltransferase [Bacteroidales bacterium]|nr:prenyltransferase [Bacteroidales bacterium]